MNEKVKSSIRHILTVVGTIIVLLGLDGLVPILEHITVSLDEVFAAIATLVGFITTLVSFFTQKERFKIRADAK